MTLKVFSIRDAKGGMFHSPFFQKSHGEAERTCREIVNDSNSFPSKYPEDYDLFFIGDFDDQSGKFQLKDSPEHILSLIQLVNHDRLKDLRKQRDISSVTQ